MAVVSPRPLSASYTRFSEPSPGQPGVTHPLSAAAAAATLAPPPRLLLRNRYSIARVQNFFSFLFFSFVLFFYLPVGDEIPGAALAADELE